MNKWLKWLCLALVIAIFMVGCQKGPEGVVAEVNGEPITREEFDVEYEYMRNYTVQTMGEDYLEAINEKGIANKHSIAKQVLENLIFRKVLEEDAARLNVEVTEEEITQELDFIKEQLNSEDTEGGGYEAYLENNAMTEEFLKKNIELQLMLGKYEEARMEEIEVTDEEIQDYFDEHQEQLIQVNVRGILVNSQEEAEDLKVQLDDGADFAELAEEHSIDPITSVEGGSFGYVYKGMLPADIEDVIFDMEPGEISDPVASENGVYIFKVEERRDTVEDLNELIDSVLRRQKYEDVIFQLRQDAEVKEYLDYKTVE